MKINLKGKWTLFLKKLWNYEYFIHTFVIVFFGLSFFITFIFWVLGICDYHRLLEIFFIILPASIVVVYIWFVNRKQITIVSITSRYLLEKEETMVDELLGILISGKWKKIKIDPIEELFKTLKKLCSGNDYEMRRRMTEAIPALVELNREESKGLIEILRKDWDDARWKSDNRRRTIESLPYLGIKKEQTFIRKCLNLIEKDEMYTLIAIIEILNIWRKDINKNEAEKLFNEIINQMMKMGYSPDDIIVIKIIWKLLYLITFYPSDAIIEIDKMKNEDDEKYLQIAIARNLRHFYEDYPNEVLNIMDWFIQRDRHKHVRRPIARECNVDFLIKMINYNEKAKEILWKLITDEDDIIRITTFDRIENIADADSEYALNILLNIIQRNRSEKLVKRAQNYVSRKIGLS